MKKIVFLFLLMVTLGVTGLSAKSTPSKKSTKPRTSQSANSAAPEIGIMDFCKPLSKYDGPIGKSAAEIIRVLENKGFRLEGITKTSFYFDDGIDDPIDMPAIMYSYEKGSIMVSCTFKCDNNKVNLNAFPYEITICEPKSEMKKFASNAKTKGFRFNGYGAGEEYEHKNYPSGVFFNIVYGDDSEIEIRFVDSH